MSTISELKKYQETKLAELFKKHGVFFAFSKEQLEEGRQEGVEYLNAGAGMVIPKNSIKAYIEESTALLKEMEDKFQKEIEMNDYILYELNNYECFYTWDVLPALEAVKTYYPKCTEEDVNNIFKRYRNMQS